MFGTHTAPRELCGRWLNTFALYGQQKASAIRVERLRPVSMTQRHGQLLRIRTKPDLDIGFGRLFHSASSK